MTGEKGTRLFGCNQAFNPRPPLKWYHFLVILSQGRHIFPCEKHSYKRAWTVLQRRGHKRMLSLTLSSEKRVNLVFLLSTVSKHSCKHAFAIREDCIARCTLSRKPRGGNRNCRVYGTSKIVTNDFLSCWTSHFIILDLPEHNGELSRGVKRRRVYLLNSAYMPACVHLVFNPLRNSSFSLEMQNELQGFFSCHPHMKMTLNLSSKLNVVF